MGKHFRTRVREARVRAGLTQAALAERFGVSQAAVSTWESGSTQPQGDVRKSVLAWVAKADHAEDEDQETGEEDTTAFGEWLYNERQARGWTREELAEKA